MLLSYADVADLRRPNPNSNRNNRHNAPDINHIRGRVRHLRVRQAAVPRFMYANGEIVKRAHAVGIDVSDPCALGCSLILIRQDIRELVLHLTADAPPPTWLRIDVSLAAGSRSFANQRTCLL